MGLRKWRNISCICIEGPDPKQQQEAVGSGLVLMFKLLSFLYADGDWRVRAPKCHGGSTPHAEKKPRQKAKRQVPPLLEKCQQADYEILEHSPLFSLWPLLPCLLKHEAKSLMFHQLSATLEKATSQSLAYFQSPTIRISPCLLSTNIYREPCKIQAQC